MAFVLPRAGKTAERFIRPSNTWVGLSITPTLPWLDKWDTLEFQDVLDRVTYIEKKLGIESGV